MAETPTSGAHTAQTQECKACKSKPDYMFTCDQCHIGFCTQCAPPGQHNCASLREAHATTTSKGKGKPPNHPQTGAPQQATVHPTSGHTPKQGHQRQPPTQLQSRQQAGRFAPGENVQARLQRLHGQTTEPSPRQASLRGDRNNTQPG